MKFKNSFLFVVLALALSACAQTVQHTPLSSHEFNALDFADAGGDERWWGDTAPPNLMEAARERKDFFQRKLAKAKGSDPVINLLTISGGGANGAFGAGILAGWTQSGERPQFDVVTGSSTGAIIAPFAFLGPQHDQTLLDIYATTTRDTVYQPKILTGLLSGSAVSDTKSLAKQIEKYVTPELLQAIAKEHEKGRRLFVVTTYFDAMRPMIWDIGYIARARPVDGLNLVRQVILASASIPVLFPPVPIEWQEGGKTFTELHVDGGMTRSVFAYPTQIDVQKLDKAQGIQLKRDIYVISNGNSDLDYDPAPVDVMGIAERTTYGLLQNQANADIDRIYYLSQRDHLNFKMIEIPDSFRATGAIDFEPEYMKALLNLGQSIGKQKDFWYKKPPSER